MLFGYENVDGKLVVNEAEAEIVRYVYDKYIEYSENPPAVLIQEVMAECDATGEVLTDEEIKSRAALKVIPYLTNEVNEKWPNFQPVNKVEQVLCTQKKQSKATKLEPIVDRDIWEQVNAQLKNNK